MTMLPNDEEHQAGEDFWLPLEGPISATVDIRDGVAVLAIKGELDGASAAAFKSAIAVAWAHSPRALVIDFSGVDFLGSAGVSVLIEARARAGVSEQFAIVVGPTTARTIEILALGEMLPAFVTVDDALHAVGVD